LNTVYAAFCGTGKTSICKQRTDCVELECWHYESFNFPDSYIFDIHDTHDPNELLFISTNPAVLSRLYGFNIELIYPDISLKSEYMDRYKNRGCHPDFTSMMDIYWEAWIKELMELGCYTHHVLQSGEYVAKLFSQRGDSDNEVSRYSPA